MHESRPYSTSSNHLFVVNTAEFRLLSEYRFDGADYNYHIVTMARNISGYSECLAEMRPTGATEQIYDPFFQRAVTAQRFYRRFEPSVPQRFLRCLEGYNIFRLPPPSESINESLCIFRVENGGCFIEVSRLKTSYTLRSHKVKYARERRQNPFAINSEGELLPCDQNPIVGTFNKGNDRDSPCPRVIIRGLPVLRARVRC